jgi:bifunctional non-homologous end joining protein LigD
MEDRESPVLYLEMTGATPDDYARDRVPQVRALPGVERATWWRNVYRDRPDLPRELPEFDTLGVYECDPTFVAPAPPDGITGHHFWQKQIPSHAPDWVARWDYPEAGKDQSHTYLVADRVATLAFLANQAVIDLHPWTSRLPDYQRPTYALIDIDPGTNTTWDEVLVLARLYRAALEHLGVRGSPKTTGKRGIQVWIPLEPRYTYDDTLRWVEGLSRAVGSTVPDLVSWDWAKADRGGKARLDYTQNAPIKTLVAPYAVRPRPGAPVSAPIRWEELDDPSLAPDRWTIRNVVERVAEVGDLYAPAQTDHQELPAL